MVLVGRNGVGKTNILKAILWAAQIATASPSSRVEQSTGNVKLSIQIQEVVFDYSVAVLHEPIEDSESARFAAFRPYLVETLTVLENGIARAIFTRNRHQLQLVANSSEIELGLMSPAITSIISLVPTHPDIPYLESLVLFLAGVRYYPLDEHEGSSELSIVSESDYKEWRGGKVEKLSADRNLLLKLLHLSKEEPDNFALLNELVGPNGLGVVRGIEVQPFDVPFKAIGETEGSSKTYFFFRFSPSNHQENRNFDFDDLSFGTKRILRLMISLIYDRSSVSLIEQPEDGIHPGLLYKLLPILRDNEISGQFIFTSHSPDVLNRVAPTEIRLVQLADGVSTLRALTKSEVEAACNYMEEDGPLSDFLISIQDF